MDGETFEADWYADPTGRSNERFYDGQQWTSRVRPNAASPEAVDPLAATHSTATTGEADKPESAVGFLDRIGPHGAEREHAELPASLAGIGGAVAALGVVTLIAQDGQRGAIIGAGLVCLAIAYAVALKVLNTQSWLQPAAVGTASVGIFAVVIGMFSQSGGSDVFGRALVIAGALHIAAWIAPGLRGRPFLLGGGVVATSLGLSALVTGGGSCDDDFFGGCNPAESAAGQLGLATGSGITLLVIGSALLFGVYQLDSRGEHGVATTVAAACLITMILGALVLSADLGSTASSLFIIVVGLAVGIVGNLAHRRAMIWTGAALVAGGTLTLALDAIDPQNPTGAAMLLIILGAVIVGVPQLVVSQRAQSINESTTAL